MQHLPNSLATFLMNIDRDIIKQKQKIARMHRYLALQKIKKRKAETRHKIQLGGLVVKAKMDQHSKAIILGALIDAYENLQKDDNIKTLFKIKGEAAFMGY
jgi:hypothetical protein